MQVELLVDRIRLEQPLLAVTLLGTDILWVDAVEITFEEPLRIDVQRRTLRRYEVHVHTTHRQPPFVIDLRFIDLETQPRWTNDLTGAQNCVDDLRPYIRKEEPATPALPSVKRSIEYDVGALQLEGDEDAPGANKVYGTDASGDRVWKDDPTAAGINELTGDVTAGPGTGSVAAAISNNAVSNSKLADMAQARLKGRATAAGTGDPTDLTPNQASDVLDGASDPFLRTSAYAGGDVSGPASSGNNNVVLFDGATGKVIKDGGFGFTTIGQAFATIPDPGAVTFVRINADNTITVRSASDMRTDLGLGTAAVLNTGVANSFDVLTRADGDGRYAALYAPALINYTGGSQANNTTTLQDVHSSAGWDNIPPGFYELSFCVTYDANATSTGAKFSLNGSATQSFLSGMASYRPMTTDSSTSNFNGYDVGTTSASSFATTNNIAFMQVYLTLTTLGNLRLRFAAESGGTITVQNVTGFLMRKY